MAFPVYRGQSGRRAGRESAEPGTRTMKNLAWTSARLCKNPGKEVINLMVGPISGFLFGHSALTRTNESASQLKFSINFDISVSHCFASRSVTSIAGPTKRYMKCKNPFYEVKMVVSQNAPVREQRLLDGVGVFRNAST